MSKNLIIETSNLGKSFGEKKVVSSLSLQVKKGDVYGFLGPNGSGKTTTIRMLLGLIHPTQGSAMLNGYDIKTHLNLAVSGVGAVVESPSFYDYLSGRENLHLMANLIPGVSGKRIEEVLEMTGMADRADGAAGTYSTGMRQRLGIARALLNYPRLVILDEPTNGLDPRGMIEIRDIIGRLNREEGITFFISSHLLYEVEQTCNRVGVLREGKLMAEGLVNDLLDSGQEVVEVTAAAEKTNEAARLLTPLDYVSSVEICDSRVTARIEKGSSARLNRYLMNNGIEVAYLAPQNSSLEKYFIELTERNDLV